MASDDRDKVYGRLGMLEEADRAALSVSCEDSDNAAAAYTAVATHCVKSGKGIKILEHAGRSQREKNLPSWASGWSVEPRYPCEPMDLSSSSRTEVTLVTEGHRLIIGDDHG